ncbi:MAG: selenocysteine-specific translation elongation factor [Peptostreptococcaceae bacterium]|nr:selenocysteine-specific translation elongation factor [Peptostreptococcaceae bacterium]
MKHIIIGTAGHIDHGKTTLIKSLTGINTDRLKEEQKRGISIDLGFSHFDLSDSERIGIIDVPGHEKFLKNMLAGVAGMDFVMLIVSADEGVMPQTREHLDILQLIGLRKGMVVITKIDNVEEDFLPLVEEDIKDSIKGTFLENAPCVLVDSISKRGIPELIETIRRMSDEIEGRNETAPARMYIDRIFSVKGFGNVVTGTLIEGTIKIEDELMLYPDEQRVKVRGIQVHSEKADKAYAGQRVAINLAGIDKDKIERGDTLAEGGTMTPTMMLDCKIRVLETATKDIEHWDRIRMYHGAREILGRIVPLEGKIIPRGHEGYAQIRLEEKFACKAGDKIILRSYSPMETIGGGTVLDANSKKHSSADEQLVETFKIKEAGDPKDIVATHLLHCKTFVEPKEIIEKLSIAENTLKELTSELVADQKIIAIGNFFIHKNVLSDLFDKSETLLGNYHKQNPLKKGMSREEFRSKMQLNLKPKDYDVFLEYLTGEKNILANKTLIKQADFEITYTPEQQKIKDDILSRLKREALTPSLVKDYIDTPQKQAVMDGLIEEEQVTKVSEELIYDKETVRMLEEEVRSILQEKKELQMADIRDKYELSRKFAIALLEYFDRVKITKRVGDKRIPF